MNKTELINAVAERTGATKKDTEAMLNALTEVIEKALVEGDKVQLTGFGIFETKERSARTGRNPRTGETMEIPGCRVPDFKAGKQLKDAVAK